MIVIIDVLMIKQETKNEANYDDMPLLLFLSFGTTKIGVVTSKDIPKCALHHPTF